MTTWLPSSLEEAERRYDQYAHTDPFPEIPAALLNSADIADYAAATGMIWPFKDDKDWLKTCAYQVPLLGKYIYWDGKNSEHRGELEEGDLFELQPNSIAFVTLEPTFRVPYYIAIRFNLKITNIYRGILLGTGPIVDPGFQGRLSLPLHKLTPNTCTSRGAQGLIWMEFTKISQSTRQCHSQVLPPFAPRRHGTLYDFDEKKNKHDVYYYVNRAWPNGSIRSSIPDATEEAATAARKAAEAARGSRDEVARVRTIVTGVGAIGATTLLLGLAGIAYTSYQLISVQNARLDALEASVAALRYGPSGPTGVKAAIPTSISALPGRVANIWEHIAADDRVAVAWLLALTVVCVFGFLGVVFWVRPHRGSSEQERERSSKGKGEKEGATHPKREERQERDPRPAAP
jgi:deoxycytidine triphosphate deaminase